VVGKILYGEVENKHHLELGDAVWHERIPVVILIIVIAAIGMYPLLVSDMISDSLVSVIGQLAR
jgi:NADH-quinone oxidoreductase subunit M